jgi:hypothetical protein
MTMNQLRTHPIPLSIGDWSASRTPWWLWLSLPIALLGSAGSLAGIFVERIYAHETPDWESQAVGQDIANLVVLPLLLVLGYAARHSARALLAWTGLLVYTAYTFAIYAFAVHFGPLFLLYVAVLGLAVWALVGGLMSIDPERGRAADTTPHLVGFVSTFLILVAGAFALLWLSQDLPAMIDGEPSTELRDTGLLTNPVHVLDLALFLPTSVLAGNLLRRRRDWGYALAPVVLSAMAAISAGIVSLSVVHAARGEDASLVVAGVIATIGAVQVIACCRFLQGIPGDFDSTGVLRQGGGPS